MAQSAKKELVVALVGASGAVGREVLSILSTRDLVLKELRPLASSRSAGRSVEFRGEQLTVKELRAESFEGVDVAFFSAGAAVSREFVPVAVRAGAIVIDNTSAFRLEEGVPLIVPEVNSDLLTEIPVRRIFPVANCSTIQLVVALNPIHRKARIRRIVLSTYQSTSGAGRKAMDELSRQVSDLFNYREPQPQTFPHRIAFNVLPQIGAFEPDGSTGEEAKISAETKKILGDPGIGVSVTAVRVATFHCHAQAVNVETEEALSAAEARDLLSFAPGVEVIDDPAQSLYPMPVDIAGTDSVYVGRIREDTSQPNSLNLWIVADNLRKGAALNGVQILEELIARGLL